MAGPDGEWYETMRDADPAPGSSDRAFGLLLAAACSVLAVLAISGGGRSAAWWSLASLVVLAIALFAAPLLKPLNRGWRGFSLLLSKIVNPVIMGILFFAVMTPAGMILRWAGKDPLRLRRDPDLPSYWLRRVPSAEKPQTSMTRQF